VQQQRGISYGEFKCLEGKVGGPEKEWTLSSGFGKIERIGVFATSGVLFDTRFDLHLSAA
jgi:hypothetical protein